MAIDKRDRIFIGDVLPIVYECMVADNMGTQTPATPLSVYARVFDKANNVFVAIGAVGPSGNPEDPVTVTAATASRGAILTYILSEEVTLVEGNYAVFITATFLDGTVLTENRNIRVMAYR